MTLRELSSKMFSIAKAGGKFNLQVIKMESMKINSAIEYGFYYAPVFSYYFSTGSLAWKKS